MRRWRGEGRAAWAARRTIFTTSRRSAGICDNDGGKLIQRADDQPEVVKERLEAYERQTEPLTNYYRTQGVLETVDGTQAWKK